MEIIDNYLEYRKLRPEYVKWREKRSEEEAKRLTYIKENQIEQFKKQEDIKRAKAVLSAVDVMDEYSQTRAEDMEFVMQSTQGIVSYGILGAGAIGFLLGKLLTLKANKTISAAISCTAGLIASLAVVLKYFQWSAKKEVEASRNGRFEAMTKDLSSVKQFAILDDKQEAQVENKAKSIEISDEEVKKMTNANSGLGLMSSLKILFKKDDEDIAKIKKEFREKLKTDEENLTFLKPDDKQIEEAKKDKQLIQNVVEKIDIASQDYAENIELAAEMLNVAAFGSGGLLGCVANKILGLLKVDKDKSFFASGAIGIAAFSIFSVFTVKLQKQASRVARYKVKQDFMNNPDKVVYVDDEKIKNQKIEKNDKEKKNNPFEFLMQAIKDNKEYNEYLKNENKLHKQKIKAREEITLTPEQEKRAKQLQHNTFKMFNKLDEKSQSFSENTEALGEIVSNAMAIPAALIGFSGFSKVMENSTMKPFYKRFFISLIPLYLFNAFITKEQKGASRVANMLAIKEMDNYKHFIDYSQDK